MKLFSTEWLSTAVIKVWDFSFDPFVAFHFFYEVLHINIEVRNISNCNILFKRDLFSSKDFVMKTDHVTCTQPCLEAECESSGIFSVI